MLIVIILIVKVHSIRLVNLTKKKKTFFPTTNTSIYPSLSYVDDAGDGAKSWEREESFRWKPARPDVARRGRDPWCLVGSDDDGGDFQWLWWWFSRYNLLISRPEFDTKVDLIIYLRTSPQVFIIRLLVNMIWWGWRRLWRWCWWWCCYTLRWHLREWQEGLDLRRQHCLFNTSRYHELELTMTVMVKLSQLTEISE